MKGRTIKTIVYAATFDMGGMPVRQAFPSQKVAAPDPFLLLHHADVKVPSHIPPKNAGVGPHPHRGFSPVTFIFKGGVHHRDSRGNNNVIYAGGTQWMNAGMGIVHSERPPADIFDNGGRQEIIQLWVNTPAKNKMDQPSYYPLNADETPRIITADGLTKIKIHSGQLEGTPGVIPTFSPVNTFTVTMQANGKYRFNLPSGHNSFIYLLSGKLKIAKDRELDKNHAAIMLNDGDYIDVEALETAEFILGSGEPLNEPIASNGPFVMNTETEIMEAFRDYKMGKMGILIED